MYCAIIARISESIYDWQTSHKKLYHVNDFEVPYLTSKRHVFALYQSWIHERYETRSYSDMFRKHTLSLYLYTRYAPQVAIANPRNMIQTAVQEDLTSVALLPAQEM